MRLELAIAQTTAPRSSHSDKTQRLGLAVALANRPRLVLADEPTSQLDRKTAGGVLDDLRKLQRELRTSVVLVTHDRKLERHVDRVVAIRDGRTSTETRWRSDETADETGASSARTPRPRLSPPSTRTASRPRCSSRPICSAWTLTKSRWRRPLQRGEKPTTAGTNGTATT